MTGQPGWDTRLKAPAASASARSAARSCRRRSRTADSWFTSRNGTRSPQRPIRDREKESKEDMAARLKEKYNKEIKQALQKELNLENPMAVPRLEKVVLNMGLGEATQNNKLLDPLVNDLTQIAGQKPVTTKAKKSIAAFKVREEIGR